MWPGVTAYPDFTNPKSIPYWSNEIDKFHKNVSFDGLWIDMNEPSNFVPGSTSVPPCPTSQLNTPPFLPSMITVSWCIDIIVVVVVIVVVIVVVVASIRQSLDPSPLTDKTLCMTAQQYYSSHYNVHSLYGHTEAIATMKWVN